MKATARNNFLPSIVLPLSAIALVLLLPSFVGSAWCADAPTTRLNPATVQAWDRYFAWADAKVKRELSDHTRFLIQDFLSPSDRSGMRRQIESGGIVVERMHGVIPSGVRFDVPDGEIHHWWGAILIPNTTLAKLIPFLQDYEHHAGRFSDVERSRLLSKNDNHYRFYFRLKRKKSFVTAYFNTEQECDYFSNGTGKASSRSFATKIAELDNPGTASENERAPGDDHGFLWRLVSWWRFEQTEKGVIVECESASLSRDIPTVVKLFPPIAAYIRSTPKESLESVLTSIRTHAPK